MKPLLSKIKAKLPYYKDKIFKSIDVLLIYQGILFLITPTGVNQLLLQFIAAKEHYEDTRWLTYVQVKEKGYKLKDSKGKGVPIEFWSVYDIKNKKRLDIAQYEKIIALNPEDKDNYKLFCNTSYVFNGSLIEGLPPIEINKNMKNI